MLHARAVKVKTSIHCRQSGGLPTICLTTRAPASSQQSFTKQSQAQRIGTG